MQTLPEPMLGAVAFAFAALLAVAFPTDQASARPVSCHTDLAFSVPQDRLAALARGFNLTGWLDSDDGRAPDKEVLAKLRARGFTHVRLPVLPEDFTAPFSAPDDIARSFVALDRALDQLQNLGFAVSLDLHPGNRLNRILESQPEQGLAIVDALWRQVARRYARRPASTLFFEVLNEPNVDPAQWERAGPHLVETIRREAPQHTIVYALSKNQRLDELTWHAPLAQPNIVYAAHFYDPMIFTHQGLDWSNGPLQYLHDIPFPLRASDPHVYALMAELRRKGHGKAADDIAKELGNGWNASSIDAEMRQAADWSRQNKVPVVINEFGVLAWKAPPADRIRWLGAVSRLAEAHCIGWTVWDYAQGFGFVRRIGDREIPDEAVLGALLGGRPESSRGARRSVDPTGTLFAGSQ